MLAWLLGRATVEEVYWELNTQLGQTISDIQRGIKDKRGPGCRYQTPPLSSIEKRLEEIIANGDARKVKRIPDIEDLEKFGELARYEYWMTYEGSNKKSEYGSGSCSGPGEKLKLA